jgi:hypothetical protein
MRIVIADPIKNGEHIQNKVTFTENILSRISRLLKDEDKTVIGPKLKRIEEIEKDLINKELNLSNLLIKSEEIKKDTIEKAESLKIENTVIRKKLLEMVNGE